MTLLTVVVLPGRLKAFLSVAGAQQETVWYTFLVQEPHPSLDTTCRTFQFPLFIEQS